MARLTPHPLYLGTDDANVRLFSARDQKAADRFAGAQKLTLLKSEQEDLQRLVLLGATVETASE